MQIGYYRKNREDGDLDPDIWALADLSDLEVRIRNGIMRVDFSATFAGRSEGSTEAFLELDLNDFNKLQTAHTEWLQRTALRRGE